MRQRKTYGICKRILWCFVIFQQKVALRPECDSTYGSVRQKPFSFPLCACGVEDTAVSRTDPGLTQMLALWEK